MSQVYYGKKELPDGSERVAIVNGFEGPLMTKAGKPRVWNGKFTVHYWIGKYSGKRFTVSTQGTVRGLSLDEAKLMAKEWVEQGKITN